MLSSSNCYDFIYRVWQRKEPISELSQLHTADEIPIKFRVSKVHGVEKFIDEDDDVPVSSTLARFPITSRTVSVPEHAALLRDGGVRLRSILSDLGVPDEHQNAVSSDISNVAAVRLAGSLKSSIFVALVHMVVVVEVDHENHESESEEVDDDYEYDSDSESEPDSDSEVMDRVTRESMEVDEVRSMAATKSSIEGLEKVTIEEGMGCMGECMICMEEFEAGLEVTRMPCSHDFHRNCIVKWLKMSHLCPLCRYPMPHSNVH